MVDALFWIVITSEILLGGALLLSLSVPHLRIWPPPGSRSWQYGCIWILTLIAMMGTVVLGIVNWNGFSFDHPLRLGLGTAMTVLGLAFALWGMTSLGLHATQGLEGEFVTTGAYRYSRNPQYVRAIVSFAGYAVLCNSTPVFVATALGIMLFLLTPFTEEPWLRKRFGTEYDAYTGRVPRFLAFRPQGGQGHASPIERPSPPDGQGANGGTPLATEEE